MPDPLTRHESPIRGQVGAGTRGETPHRRRDPCRGSSADPITPGRRRQSSEKLHSPPMPSRGYVQEGEGETTEGERVYGDLYA